MFLTKPLRLAFIFLVCSFFTNVNALSIEYTDTLTKDEYLPQKEFSSADFVNISAIPKENAFTINWSIAYDFIWSLTKENSTVIIRYSKKNDLRTSTKWQEITNIPLFTTHYVIDELTDNTEYIYAVGVQNDDQIAWSKNHAIRTKLSWGWFKFIVLIGSLGLFTYGMKVMSEGLQQTLGSKLRNQLGSITSNQFKSILTGFSITAITQSIMASIVMVVSFVNTGLLTLRQSTGVMLGASIGTAVTVWFINLLAFEIDLSAYALFILAFSAPFLFFGKKRWKPWVNTIFGFVFLIMGLGFMVTNMPENSTEIPYFEQLLSYKEIPVVGILLFVGIGVLISVFLQSTVASIALTMALVYTSILPFDVAIALILGANIGTSINVELTSLAGNVHAKRSARIHTLFNVIGLFWALLLFPFILEGVKWFMMNIGWGNPIENSAEHGNTGLAIFYTVFNLLNTLLLVWLIPQLIKIAEKTVKSKGASDEVFHLEFIASGILNTADLSILEAKKEIAKFGILTERMSKMTCSLLFEKNPKQFEKTLNRIEKYEDITDKIEIEVVKYLNKLSEGDLTLQTATRIRGMNSMVNDLERIGDIFYQMSKTIERKTEEKLWFTPEQRNNITKLFDLVDEALIIMNENLNAHQDKVILDKANEAERKINTKRNELRNDYLENLSSQDTDTNFKAGMIYHDLFSSLEKVGDHILNVSEAIVGKV
jgi:phosphate:Na+ symporter